MLQARWERSQKRKKLLAQTLGVSSVDELRQILGTDVEDTQKKRGRLSNDKSDNAMKDLKDDTAPTDEIVYKDSSTFLKGTQSSNPHNDYCQHFIDTGQRPQNFIRDVGLADRFEEYPKLRELIKLKDDLIAETATPPMYLKTDLLSYNLKELNCKCDVILIEPPLEEYQRTCGATNVQLWNWDQIMELDIGEVAANRSFVFLWCGSSDGLDMGRFCLRKWGFRRCEDICWIRTNINNPGHSKNLDSKAVLQRTKEHCLMGIKGTVRRSTDGDFIHANVDIDLIISEEPDYGSIEKPVEIFHIIEHFCLGRRRLHLFGRDSTIRPGWLTVGPELTNTNFNADLYQSYFTNGQITTGCTERIEALRPKSPPPKGKVSGRGRGGFNRGRASACVYQEEFCGGRGIGEQDVYACVVVAGTGWRWWLFHLFAHDNRLSNQAVRGFSGQRLIVTVKKCLASRSAPPSSSQSSLNSHKYVDSPASRPIVSRGKRARKSGRDNTNFLGQSTVTEVWA